MATLLAVAASFTTVPPARADLLWYQQYEAGLEAAGNEAWSEALEHFRAAARVEALPQPRARTYGREFLFDYDPPYQQARCLAALGQPSEAREQIALSRAAGVTPAETLQALEASLEPTATSVGDPPHAPALPGAPARIRVESSPSGSRVFVDDRQIGVTPLSETELPVGSHRLRLTAVGFEPWAQEIDSRSGEVLHLDIGLTRLDTRADEGVEASPPREATDPLVTEPLLSPRPSTAETTAIGAADSSTTLGEHTDDEGPVEGSAASLSEPLSDPPTEPTLLAADAPKTASSVRPWLPVGAFVAIATALSLLGWRRRSSIVPGAKRSSVRLPHGTGSVGGYKVIEPLGRGGMATTFRAHRRSDGQPAALKIPHESGDPTYLERFVREGQLGESLHHPGIVRIFEAGEDSGLPFMAMELVEGKTLREILDASPEGLEIERAVRLARDIFEAVDYAHAKGVVHRDLKPSNVMVSHEGTLKVMDFGVARVEGQPGLTASQFFFGSPVYAAPEMIDPREASHRSDLYSLGIVLFELVEGHPPFVHESVFQLLELHQKQPLPAPGELPRPLPAQLWSIIERLCRKDPRERFGSAQEVLVELARLANEPRSSSAADRPAPARSEG